MALTPTDPTKAEIWIRGTAPNQIIDLYVPRGAKGDPGGFVEGTELGTNHLNTIVTPGIYKQTTSANVSSANGYPFSGIVASLMVTRARTQDIIQTLRPGNGVRAGATIYERASGDTGTTWSAWRVYASQRTDQSAGRAIYGWDDLNNREQLIYGDTGLRIITLENGYSGTFYLRRVGNIVNATGTVVRPPGGSFNGKFLTIPSGFAPSTSTWVYTAVRNNGSSATFWLYRQNTDLTFTDSNAGNETDTSQTRIDVSWTTNQAWPTTLPGTASGSIPNT